jgi:CheY-like chemotaxis protein
MQCLGEVLLLEDNPGDVRFTKEMFKEAGLDVSCHVSTNRRDALDFLYQRGTHADVPRPNVIFLDWYFNGGVMLAEIQRIDALDTVPVVVLTGTRAEFQDLENGESGAADHVLKPIEPKECRSLANQFSVAQ